MLCLCHSGKEYKECCKAYHEGAGAPTALLLMRSRYSAYAMGNVNYIMKTTYNKPSGPKSVWKRQLEDFSKRTTFEGLEIILDEPGENTSYVTFHAILKQGVTDVSFTERSRFIKEGGVWYYVIETERKT